MSAKLKHLIEREKMNVRGQIAALQRLQAERFAAGDRVLVGEDPLPVLISAGLDPQHAQRHFVWLGASAQPPPLAQNLACGVLSEDGQLADAGRTDRMGHVAVDLAEGEYCLRFVAEVRDTTDVEILVRIGDEAAYEQLAAALRYPSLSAAVRTAADRALRAHRDASATLKPAPARSVEVPRLRPDLATSADARGPRPVLEAERGWWIDRETRRLRVRYPADQVPFGAVLIELHEGDVRLASRLMPVDRTGSDYANSIGLDELSGERDYPESAYYVLADERILLRVSLEEVDRVLESEYVKRRTEVAQRLLALRKILAERLDSDRLGDGE